MGMFVNSSGGGRRRARHRPMSEINVTPMVDVMLVLLVIFMVTAPLLTTGVEVNLPSTKTPQIRDPDNKALTVSVRPDGSVFLNETAVTLATLPARLQAITAQNAEARIYVRGDEQANYGTVMEVLGTLHASGFSQAALITRPPGSSSK